MDALEHQLNAMNDSDQGWWPFLGMRPAKDQPLADTRVATLAAAYGAMFGVIFNFFAAAFQYELLSRTPWIAPMAMIMMLFLSYRFLFAWAWNRRASRMVTVRAMRS